MRTAASTRTNGPDGSRYAVIRPGPGRKLRGILGVDPALDRVAHGTHVRQVELLAERYLICIATRSSPVTISVTVCSTCSRVFISRK